MHEGQQGELQRWEHPGHGPAWLDRTTAAQRVRLAHKERKRAEIEQMGRGFFFAGRLALTLSTAALAVAFLAAGAALVLGGEVTAPVSTDDVAAGFEASASGGGTPFGADISTSGDTSAQAEPGAASASDAADAGKAQVDASAPGGGAASDGGAGSSGPPLLVPPQGTYRYSGSGQERSDIGTTNQGPEIPATVQHVDDRCWKFRIHYHQKRWTEDTYCASADGGLVRTAARSELQIEVLVYKDTVQIDTTCAHDSVFVKAGMTPGTSFRHDCTITNTTLEGATHNTGPATFAGEETIDVGGRSVVTYRIDTKSTVTGAQNGSATATWWFAKENGLPIANRRSSEFTSPMPFGLPGSTTATETGEFTLTSVDPV